MPIETPSKTNAVEVADLGRSYDKIQAVRGVSFRVEKGTLCGLVGPNGAGKSTLLKMLMGLLEPDSGEITIAAAPVKFGQTEYKRHLGYAPESPALYEYLTGREFLYFVAGAQEVPAAEREGRIAQWLSFFDLSDKANELIFAYSHGMRRKISLAAALLHSPRLLLLDEATNGLDPESSFRLKEWLREYCRQGGTVLFSSHILETVEHLCDRILVLNHGRLLRDMPRSECEGLRTQGRSLEQEFIAMVRSSD